RLAAGGHWLAGAALVPLRDRDGQEVVGAVAVRPRPAPHGPLPGGLGFAFPVALLAVAAAAVTAFRERSLRGGSYVGAALLLALATYFDVWTAARQSTDRWLIDTRRLLQEAATRLPPPRTRVAITELAGLVRDGEIVAGGHSFGDFHNRARDLRHLSREPGELSRAGARSPDVERVCQHRRVRAVRPRVRHTGARGGAGGAPVSDTLAWPRPQRPVPAPLCRVGRGDRAAVA